MSSYSENFSPVPVYPPDNMGDYLTAAELATCAGVTLKTLFARYRLAEMPRLHFKGLLYLYPPETLARLDVRKRGRGRPGKHKPASGAFYRQVVKG